MIEARKNGQKHSAAVTQTVELIKQRHPMMRISETEVKRTLAVWRPRGSHTILRFECSTLSGEELAKHYWIEAQSAAMSQEKSSKLSVPSDVILPKSLTTYKMYFGEAELSSNITANSQGVTPPSPRTFLDPNIAGLTSPSLCKLGLAQLEIWLSEPCRLKSAVSFSAEPDGNVVAGQVSLIDEGGTIYGTRNSRTRC